MAGINFKAFDLGGHEIARRVWKDYYAKVPRSGRLTYCCKSRICFCCLPVLLCFAQRLDQASAGLRRQQRDLFAS